MYLRSVSMISLMIMKRRSGRGRVGVQRGKGGCTEGKGAWVYRGRKVYVQRGKGGCTEGKGWVYGGEHVLAVIMSVTPINTF